MARAVVTENDQELSIGFQRILEQHNKARVCNLEQRIQRMWLIRLMHMAGFVNGTIAQTLFIHVTTVKRYLNCPVDNLEKAFV